MSGIQVITVGYFVGRGHVPCLCITAIPVGSCGVVVAILSLTNGPTDDCQVIVTLPLRVGTFMDRELLGAVYKIILGAWCVMVVAVVLVVTVMGLMKIMAEASVGEQVISFYSSYTHLAPWCRLLTLTFMMGHHCIFINLTFVKQGQVVEDWGLSVY